MLSDEQLAERVRVQLRAELDDLVVPPDVLDGMWAAARPHTDGRDETRRARPRRRSRRFTFANVATRPRPYWRS